MSSLRKSASFRSRIPVRRNRVSARRCISPQPSTSTRVTSATSSNYCSGTESGRSVGPIAANACSGDDGGGQQWYERRYSSSSYSSSDESHESEGPLKLLLKHSPESTERDSTRQHMATDLSVSTDAISLDGLLDCVSSGSFSSPPSPKEKFSRDSTIHQPGQDSEDDDDDERITSSCESLEKLNYALETLKISDTFHSAKQAINQHYENLINENNAVDQRQHADSEKQRKLSDWYYIKTSPKQKRNKAAASPCAERRNQRLAKDEPCSPPADRKQALPPCLSGNLQQGQALPAQLLIAGKCPTEAADEVNFTNAPQNPAERQQHRPLDSNLVNCNKFSSPVGRSIFIPDNDGHLSPPKPPPNASQRIYQRSASPTMAINDRELSPPVTNKCFDIRKRTTRAAEQPPANVPSKATAAAVRNRRNCDITGATTASSSFEHIPEIIDLCRSTGISPTKATKQNIYENFPPHQTWNHVIEQRVELIGGNGESPWFGPNGINKHQLPQPYAIEDTDEFRYKNAVERPLPKGPPSLPPLPPPVAIAAIEYGEEDHQKKSSSLTMCYPTKTNQQQQQQQQHRQHYHHQITTPASYRTDYELCGSYVSLECPSPPGPPACFADKPRDPQARLARYLRTLYTELALKEPVLPTWVQPVAPGVLCPARLEPELRLHIHSHCLNECITVDQILAAVQTKDGPFLEAPRRVLIECPPWITRSALALRILHAWSREPTWPPRGQPVALALFIPLNELKGSLAQYVGKELLPRGPQNPFASGFGGFNAAWSSLESLKSKLLIVLDGYDVQSKSRKYKAMPKDVVDLLEGRLFPEARVILISVTSSCEELLPLMQRHVSFEGITWGRSVSLLGGGQWGAPTRLIDSVQDCRFLRNIARNSLGCLAISSIYAANSGDLLTDEIDVIASVFNCVAANSSHTQVTELGRLALFCLKTKRSTVTSAELKMYCSSPEINIIGCLDKAPVFGRTARRKSEFYYTTICPGIAEFLAANYLVSLASRPGLLAAEVAGLAIGDEVEPEILKVLTYAMSLLGSRAYLLLSKLTPLWLSPQTIFSLALAGGETEANLTALCELLGISKSPPIPPLEAKPIWVQIKSTPSEMQGWGLALKSPTCTLKNLELVYQIEKNMLLESRNVMDIFLDALSKNESVTTLRITSLIENEVRDSDINYLATCISKTVLKPRLESFELILTLLEEDPPILKLQSVVTGLCRVIPRQPKLSNLILDLGLCTSQLVQICSMLEKCPHVTRLSFPHLRCERGAVGALANLLNARPLSYLALPSSWGARDDPPSSSGVSMGSGSGSSSGNSGLIKQSSLTGAPSPRSYPTGGIFSSLPRGVLNSTSNPGRSATLPRQPMDGPPDKRSTDSVISRTWYPTPACDGGPHNSGTLHELLLAARDSYSRLHGLDLSKAQLSLEDSMCLGETVRLSTTLHSLKLEGASRLSEILPAVLGASESPSLQMLSLGSPRIALEDAAVGMSARALGSCITLRLLSLDGWSFRIENIGTLASVRGFLSLTSIRELGLNNCRLNLSMFKSDIVMPGRAYECRSIVNLKMAGAQIIFSDHVSMKGPHVLPYLSGFVNLRELDLSAPSRTGLGSTSSTPLILSDKDIIGFFTTLNANFSSLNTLKICNWILHVDDAVRTLKTISKLFKSSPMSHVKVDGIIVLDRPKKQRIEGLFMHALLGSLPQLRWLGITVTGLSEEQIVAIGTYCADIRGMEIDIRLCDSSIENARLMTHSLGLDGKFDIRVSTFGTSNSILIHIEKTSTKSLSRK
ncbi:uncharacterized protein LOC129762793 [Toxorhynchites rutilus septentrionalis]|uniref:uncharacterized protein LOC129762793 n=1 Tax=Toxorhynchites rutilus septentrionalis TaxID=329112 RepID=UPI00247859AD|nr:uncharacterized protein LOC129762793 [Toxorhynchites rutilus septentrionalis]